MATTSSRLASSWSCRYKAHEGASAPVSAAPNTAPEDGDDPQDRQLNQRVQVLQHLHLHLPGQHP